MEKNRILIVDDVPDNLKLLGNILDEAYSLSFATGGQEALDMLSDFLPDLILLDIMMPKIDGFEVCRRLQEDKKRKHIPIIFLTAKTDRESVIKGMSVGGKDYIVKPFSSDDVLERIAIQLNKRSLKIDLIPGRDFNESDEIFWENRYSNMLIFMTDQRRVMAREISMIESELETQVSMIPELLNYFKAIEKLLYSPEMRKHKDLHKMLDAIQKKRLNPEFTAALHLLPDKFQTIQYRLLDFIGEYIELEEDEKKKSFSLKNCIRKLDARLPGNIPIHWQFSEDREIQGDENSLIQVLTALVDNAIDAINNDFEKQSCYIKIDEKPPVIQISVIDSGPGIKPEIMNELCEPQFTCRDNRNGYGLTAVKILLETKLKGKLLFFSGSPCKVKIEL